MSCFLFIVFFAPNKQVLLVGEILLGFEWGIFATTAPAYASEVLPLQLRVYFTSYTNMCFIIGQFISGGVLRGLVHRKDQWGYRIPFAIQWFWPLLLIPIIFFAPESPYHLVRHNKFDEAEKSIRRLQRQSCKIDPKDTLATIVYTNNLEEQLSVGTSYWDCFKGFERRRTEIACVVFGGQLVCGLCFAYGKASSTDILLRLILTLNSIDILLPAGRPESRCRILPRSRCKRPCTVCLLLQLVFLDAVSYLHPFQYSDNILT